MLPVQFNLFHRDMKGRNSPHGFTIVELLVVISIIALLIALLLPALAMAKQDAVSIDCLSNLRSQGQMLFEYASEYEGAIPYGEMVGGSTPKQYLLNEFNVLLYTSTQGNQNVITNAWYDSTPQNIAAYQATMEKFARIFVCPASTLPIEQGSQWWYLEPCFYSTYACNPNFFMLLYLNGAGGPNNTNQNYTVRLSNVQNPGQKLAIGDATQNQSPTNASWQLFNWQQNEWPWAYPGDFPPDYLIAANGIMPGLTSNIDGLATSWFTGLRYRHGETSPDNGWANAVFFDGHAQSVPINQNVQLAPPTSTGAIGTTGLRMLNIINPDLPASIRQW